MQVINLSGLKALEKTFNKLLKEAPEARQRLNTELGELAEKELRASMADAGINENTGFIKSRQIKHIGSRGGYVTVRPAGGTEGGGTGKDSAGAITNYLENGHKIPSHKRTKEEGYRPRIKLAFVRGRHFYRSANASIEAKAITLAQKFADDIAEKISGGG
ncbi:MAG: hypothetical protein RR787_08350 [Hydrogenoanaerobacterium sp.]